MIRKHWFDVIYYYQPRDAAWHREMGPTLNRLKTARDDRAFVLVAAMFVEHQIDSLLGTYFPRYKTHLQEGRLTLSDKTGLVRATGLVPDQLVDFADALRRIRNDFAHDLKCDTLGRMPRSRKDMIRHLARDLQTPPQSHSLRQLLLDIVYECALGFRLQRMNAELYRKTVKSKGFKKLLDKNYQALKIQKERPT